MAWRMAPARRSTWLPWRWELGLGAPPRCCVPAWRQQRKLPCRAGGRKVAPLAGNHPFALMPAALPAAAALQKHIKALAGYGEEHMLVKKARALYEEARAASSG